MDGPVTIYNNLARHSAVGVLEREARAAVAPHTPAVVVTHTAAQRFTHAKNANQPVFRSSSLNALHPGSGREIPAICHGMVILA